MCRVHCGEFLPATRATRQRRRRSPGAVRASCRAIVRPRNAEPLRIGDDVTRRRSYPVAPLPRKRRWDHSTAWWPLEIGAFVHLRMGAVCAVPTRRRPFQLRDHAVSVAEPGSSSLLANERSSFSAEPPAPAALCRPDPATLRYPVATGVSIFAAIDQAIKITVLVPRSIRVQVVWFGPRHISAGSIRHHFLAGWMRTRARVTRGGWTDQNSVPTCARIRCAPLESASANSYAPWLHVAIHWHVPKISPRGQGGQRASVCNQSAGRRCTSRACSVYPHLQQAIGLRGAPPAKPAAALVRFLRERGDRLPIIPSVLPRACRRSIIRVAASHGRPDQPRPAAAAPARHALPHGIGRNDRLEPERATRPHAEKPIRGRTRVGSAR